MLKRIKRVEAVWISIIKGLAAMAMERVVIMTQCLVYTTQEKHYNGVTLKQHTPSTNGEFFDSSTNHSLPHLGTGGLRRVPSGTRLIAILCSCVSFHFACEKRSGGRGAL
jgi:hypothetical protein